MTDPEAAGGPDEEATLPADERGGAIATGHELDDKLLQRDVKARMFGSKSEVVVGGYVISQRIGAGGMGIVYAARDPRLERDVALKLVLPGHARGQERMLREARALARLAHPNVVTIHEVGTHGDRVFVAMELVRGTTLRKWLETPRSLRAIAEVFAQAAEGLAAAHRAGLVHRDFKPENVLIGEDETASRSSGRVRVVDFGLARMVSDLEPARPVAGADVHSSTLHGGTPSYMALEQFEGGDIDARADIFAFCVALYEALHGRRPYDGAQAVELARKIASGPAVLAWRRDLPRALVSLVRAGLSPRADDRPSSIEPFVGALRRLESPPRRRVLALAAAASLATAGMGTYWLFRAPAEPRVETVAGAADPDPSSEHVCPADVEPDPRSCDELAEHLLVHHDDWAARCAFRRACAEPDPRCPEGTEWNGTLGCALPVCSADSEEASIPRCEQGDVACCADAANVRYEMSEGDDGGRVVEDLAKACAAGDANGCVGLASVARQLEHDEASAVAALVTACRLGHVQGCRRIATLAEEREGLQPQCTTAPDEDCPPLEERPVQLAHFAACRTASFEIPGLLQEPEHRLSKAFASERLALSAEEAEAIDRAEQRLAEALLREYRGLWSAAGGGSEGDALPLPALAQAVEHSIMSKTWITAVNAAVQKLADARAGIEPARPAVRTSLVEQLFVLQASLGGRLEEEVARELGRERAAALHREHGLWPGAGLNRMQGRCPG